MKISNILLKIITATQIFSDIIHFQLTIGLIMKIDELVSSIDVWLLKWIGSLEAFYI